MCKKDKIQEFYVLNIQIALFWSDRKNYIKVKLTKIIQDLKCKPKKSFKRFFKKYSRLDKNSELFKIITNIIKELQCETYAPIFFRIDNVIVKIVQYFDVFDYFKCRRINRKWSKILTIEKFHCTKF